MHFPRYLKLYHIALLGMLITLSFSADSLYSQGVTRPSRQAAYDAFDRGDYDKAFREFSILLENYPKDPVYKYYCGVCLVKSEKDPGKAAAYIGDALSNQQEIRPLPGDAWFYLARAQQMDGKYQDAVTSYNLFEKYAGKKAARDLKVQDLIRECNEGKGKLREAAYGEVIEKAAAGRDSLLNSRPVRKKEPVPESYDKDLTEAMDYQVKADSLNALAVSYRQEYEKIPAAQKPSAKARIDETEALSSKYQKMADEKFGRSDSAGRKENEAIAADAGLKPAEKVIRDTFTKRADTGKVSSAYSQPPAEVAPPTVDVFSIFAVASDPAALSDQKIDIDPRLPAGLIYRIQIGVYSKPITVSYFKGIIPVSGSRIPGTTSVRYFAGMFRRSDDAGKALLKVRQAGFRDAFVVAVSDGKRVSLERAALLEKEWGQKPFLTVTGASVGKPGTDVTPTLVFRVELMKTLIPVSEESAESLRNLASSRGLEILMKPDGTFVYLIGKFITFESADEYASLLKRNGYNNARIAAYLGEREIPVEKAKQLFEKVE